MQRVQLVLTAKENIGTYPTCWRRLEFIALGQRAKLLPLGVLYT